MTGSYLSVVIPVFKNRATVRPLYEQLRFVLEKESAHFEIVFVNDECPEGSLEILRALEREDDRVRVIALFRNVGQNRAILEGLRAAKGERVILMDADLQDPPDAIPRLLKRLDEGKYSAVFAGRRGRYETIGRLVTSRAFKGALHLLTGLPPDAGLFVALNRAMIEKVLSFSTARSTVVAMIGCTGLPATSIPVERRPRTDGKSAYQAGTRLAMAVNALYWVAKTKIQTYRKHEGMQP